MYEVRALQGFQGSAAAAPPRAAIHVRGARPARVLETYRDRTAEGDVFMSGVRALQGFVQLLQVADTFLECSRQRTVMGSVSMHEVRALQGWHMRWSVCS